MVLDVFCMVLIIGWVAQTPQMCGFLRWPILQWIGLCSYSIYLWQQLFTGLNSYYLYPPFKDINPVVGLALALLCGGLSYYLIERPTTRLGRKLVARRSEAATPAEVVA